MKHRQFAALAAALACALTIATPGARAPQKQVWKASDVHPLGYPTVAAVESLGKKLEKATEGRISVQMYASMQLGGEKEAIEQAQVGAIQIARVSVGALGPVIDDLVRDTEGGILGSTSGRFFGWVTGGTLPVALAADWPTSAWDQNGASNLTAPAEAIV